MEGFITLRFKSSTELQMQHKKSQNFQAIKSKSITRDKIDIMWRGQYRTDDNFSRHLVTRPISKTFPPLSGVRAKNRIWLSSLRRDAHFLIGNKSAALLVARFFSLQRRKPWIVCMFYESTHQHLWGVRATWARSVWIGIHLIQQRCPVLKNKQVIRFEYFHV